MKYISIFALVAVLVSCKKKDDPEPTPPSTPATPSVTTPLANGLPANPTAIDAYLYSSYNRDVSYMSDFNHSMFSVFATSSRNLMANYDHSIDQPAFTVAAMRGDVDLGDVTFSGSQINKSASPTNSQYFTSTVKSNTMAAAVWEAPKVGRFLALSQSIDRGYPKITVPTAYHISINNGFKLKLSDYVLNFDSVTFQLSSSPINSGGFFMAKTLPSSADSVIFTADDLSDSYPAYNHLYLSIKAYNYSNRTISDLKYVFELSNKISNKPFSLGY